MVSLQPRKPPKQLKVAPSRVKQPQRWPPVALASYHNEQISSTGLSFWRSIKSHFPMAFIRFKFHLQAVMEHLSATLNCLDSCSDHDGDTSSHLGATRDRPEAILALFDLS